MSGFSLNHGDIGGYCSVALPGPFRVIRSQELLLRWMEVAAFTPVFRTHEGNLPNAGAQAYSDARTLAHFGRMARVYVAWDFYRQQLMQVITILEKLFTEKTRATNGGGVLSSGHALTIALLQRHAACDQQLDRLCFFSFHSHGRPLTQSYPRLLAAAVKSMMFLETFPF